MGLTLASIRRPVFISMFVLALVILGIRARQAMPQESQPDIDSPYVTIVTAYAGSGPQEIETLVTKPLEDAVAGVNGLKHITSTSRDGLSTISLEFFLGTNVDTAAADVRDKVSSARNSLPRDISDPAVSKLDITGKPVMTLGMVGTMSPRDLRHLADTTVKDAFSQVAGTAAVYVDGGQVREVQVQVDKNRLQAYGMSLSQVVAAINAQNQNLPGGTVKETGQEYAVRLVGEFTNPEQIRDVRIQVPGKEGQPAAVVTLKDVATVSDTVQDPDTITRLGVGDKAGTPSVVLAVQKQSGGNTVQIADGVKDEMALLLGQIHDKEKDVVRDWDPKIDKGPRPSRILPAGVGMIIATDDSQYVKDSLTDVNNSLVEGVLLVVLIVFLFLHSARATFIVALAIPTSMFATFLPMHALGYSLNFMTLLGLSLAVGILVDDSIVVLENIERHLRKGEDPMEAAVNGRSEIGLAAIAITMVDVVVFLPIANMGGIVGQFFRPFGYSVAIATLFSLFMSFTLTPMLASRFFTKGHGSEADRMTRRGFWAGVFRRFDTFYNALDRVYENLLAWTLENRSLTIWTGWAALFTAISMMLPPLAVAHGPKMVVGIIVTVMMLVGMAFSKDRLSGVYILAMMLGLVALVSLPLAFEFIPTVDQGQFGVTIEAQAGQSLQHTDQTVTQVANVIRNLKDPKSGKPIVEYAIATTGASSSGASQGAGDAGSQYGNVNVKLVEKGDRSESIDDVIRRVTQLTAGISGAKIEAQVAGGIGNGKPITEEVTGPDLTHNVAVADKLLANVKKIPGIVNADTSWKVGKPELQITVDQERAADKGLTSTQIGDAVRTALEGSGDSPTDTKYREQGDQYTIRVQYDKLDRNNAAEVGSLVIATNNGAPVYLKDVADITLGSAPTQIQRKDRQELITVDASVAQGYSQGNLQAAVDKVVTGVPTGTSRINVGGTGAVQAESAAFMGAALGLAVVLVYMLMAALFESLTTPFVIWLCLPQAMVGALLGLMVANKGFSIVAMIGLIMLMGLVTKNAILLIDYTNTLRSRGKDRRSAILEAGPTRLRPVLMTTLAMIGGMLPTALAVNRGSEQRQPMAVAVIGGLVLSTMLTLLVIPTTYSLMDDIVSGSRNRWLSLMGRRHKKPEQIPVESQVQPVGGE